MWHFYIVRCQDNSLYCGISQNTLSRIIRHNQGNGATWFKKHGPGLIVYEESFEAFEEARSREAQIKRWSRMKKEKLIKGEHPSTRHASRDSLGVKSSEKILWNREFSAGGIVYKKDHGQIFILMVMPMGRNFGPPEGYWAFPKGKIDEGEDTSETALREVEEEAGVKAKIIEDLKSIKFFRNYDKTLKFVHYYLMEYVSGDPKDHDKEIAETAWVALDEVESRLKFEADKEVFARAKKLLRN